MKGRLVSPNEFNDWDTEIGNFGFGYTDFATGINKKSNQKWFFSILAKIELGYSKLPFFTYRYYNCYNLHFLYCTVLIIWMGCGVFNFFNFSCNKNIFCNLMYTLESGIEIGQGKFVKSNKCGALTQSYVIKSPP